MLPPNVLMIDWESVRYANTTTGSLPISSCSDEMGVCVDLESQGMQELAGLNSNSYPKLHGLTVGESTGDLWHCCICLAWHRGILDEDKKGNEMMNGTVNTKVESRAPCKQVVAFTYAMSARDRLRYDWRKSVVE